MTLGILHRRTKRQPRYPAPASDARYSAPEMKAPAPQQQRPVAHAGEAPVARKPMPQVQQPAAGMDRPTPRSSKPTSQVGTAPGPQRPAADTGRQAPMSQKPISQEQRPAASAGHSAQGNAMRNEQPARKNVETKPEQY
ncbi:hypothetical protein OSTOST_01689 [Ostertagia ostertagi]